MSLVSRRGRFLAAPPRLTELTLDRLVDAVDQVDHVAVLLLAPAGHPEEAPVGVGRMIRYTRDPATADIALAVADDWQGRGVGSALARALIAHCPLRVTRLATVVAADNRASLATPGQTRCRRSRPHCRIVHRHPVARSGGRSFAPGGTPPGSVRRPAWS